MACCNTVSKADARLSAASRTPTAHPTTRRSDGESRLGIAKLCPGRTNFEARFREILSRSGSESCQAHRDWLECMKDVFRDIDYIGDKEVTEWNGIYVDGEKLTKSGNYQIYLGQEKFVKWHGSIYLGGQKITRHGLRTYFGNEEVHPDRDAKQHDHRLY